MFFADAVMISCKAQHEHLQLAACTCEALQDDNCVLSRHHKL